MNFPPPPPPPHPIGHGPGLLPGGHPRNPIIIDGRPYIRAIIDAAGHEVYSPAAPLREAFQDQPGLPYRLLNNPQHGGARQRKSPSPAQLASLVKARHALALKRAAQRRGGW